MCKTPSRLFSLYFNLINPLHVLNIQHRNILVEFFIFEIRRAEVSTKENKKHLIDNTTLLLLFDGVLPGDVGHRCPFLLRHVEGVIILQDSGVVSPVNDDLVSVGDHVMEGPPIWQGFLSLGTIQLHVNFGQRAVELRPTVSTKYVYIISNATHGMSFYSLVRELKLATHRLPLKGTY